MGQDVSVAEAKAGNQHLMPVVPSTNFHADGLKSGTLDYPRGQTSEDQPGLSH